MNPLVQVIDERIKEYQARNGKYYGNWSYDNILKLLEELKQLFIVEETRVVKELEARRQEATEKMDAYPDIDSIEHLIGLSELTDYTRAITIVKNEK